MSTNVGTLKYLIAIALIFTSNSLFAFGLGDLNLPGTGNSNQQAAQKPVDSIAMQNGIIKDYMFACPQILKAQLELAKAFDLKDQVSILDAQITALSSGSTLDPDPDTVKQTIQISQSASDAEGKIMDKGTQLSEEGKKHYIASLPPFALGVAMTTKMPKDLIAFGAAAKSQIQSASIVDKAKLVSTLKTGTYMATALPSYFANVLDSMKKVVTYGKNNNIPIPDDATKALANL